MSGFANRLVDGWIAMGPRFMPFADIATSDLPFSRVLRLSLFQVSVGMALVMLVGTLNRVMIVELGVPASLVGLMLALPLVVAPFRALVGFRSDTHRCELGWRRVPFIWKGTMLQFGGFAVMPFALLVLAGSGESVNFPTWIGNLSAALAFLLVGAGLHTVQTAGLALATDLTVPESHPRVVGLMYFMLLIGMIGSALLFGSLLEDFSPGRLVQVVQGAALATVVLNAVAMWKQEPRRPPRGRAAPAPDATFSESWALFCKGDQAVQRLIIVGLGTLAFSMSDILLEPFGGQILGLSVAATTRLTALLALGGLLGFMFASQVRASGAAPYRMALSGAVIGLAALTLVIVSAPYEQTGLFVIGNFLIGFGGAFFGHGTLTASMRQAPRQQAGLAIGAWGAVQASAAGVAMAMSGAIRDLVNAATASAERVWIFERASAGYISVYLLEILLLIATVGAIVPLIRAWAKRRQAEADDPDRANAGAAPGTQPGAHPEVA